MQPGVAKRVCGILAVWCTVHFALKLRNVKGVGGGREEGVDGGVLRGDKEGNREKSHKHVQGFSFALELDL
jgi:hypothetical protein